MSQDSQTLVLFTLDQGRVGLKCSRCNRVFVVSYDLLFPGNLHVHPHQAQSIFEHGCDSLRCSEMSHQDREFYGRHRANPFP